MDAARPPMLARARVVAADIKLAHSVFALPFALLGAVMALAHGGSIQWRSAVVPLLLVVAAMVAARSAAMVANRLLDREIDARNPRTAGRAIPSGRLRTHDAVAALLVSSSAFVAVCAVFGVLEGNWWPLMLSVPVLAWITLYGLFKRFTWACHLWLGASLAMSVPAAALAVAPPSLENPAIWWIALAVLAWVAGFDVIYALQDIEVDRAEGLHSVPARFGWTGALAVSRALHAVAAAALLLAWRSDARLGAPFAIAVALAIALLVLEQATVRRWGTSRMALTFFTINGCVSILLGGAGILGVALTARPLGGADP